MKWLGQFARFWYDFIVGDDWRLAICVVVMVGVVTLLAHRGVDWWWLLPGAVAALLALSITRELRKAQSAK